MLYPGLFHIYPPSAVEVVLTLAAASGDRGRIEPEGWPAVPIAAALISIITVEQQSTSTPQPIDISIWKRTYCHPGHSRPCLICLFITADRGPVWRRLIIIMYRLRLLSTNASLPNELACGNKRRRGVWCRYSGTDWLTDWLSHACWGFQSQHEFCPIQRGRQMPDLITGMTLINQLISNPEK